MTSILQFVLFQRRGYEFVERIELIPLVIVLRTRGRRLAFGVRVGGQ